MNPSLIKDLTRELNLYLANENLLYLATSSKLVWKHMTGDNLTIESIHIQPRNTKVNIKGEDLSIAELVEQQVKILMEQNPGKERKLLKMLSEKHLSILVQL